MPQHDDRELPKPAPNEDVGHSIGNALEAQDVRENAERLEQAGQQLAAARETLAGIRSTLDN